MIQVPSAWASELMMIGMFCVLFFVSDCFFGYMLLFFFLFLIVFLDICCCFFFCF